MERYICIHGHFYQPPRENPWLEAVELQDSAYPFHDWNERITAECYGANARSRLLDERGRIVDIVNNYAKISFNFGPTLLAWLEAQAPDTYRAILAADHESRRRFAGHGSALAQAYNHMILPLADGRDRRTQVVWGIRDFEHRFGRRPEGLWLPETAVDLETLDLLAEHGIAFTILAPHQAGRVRAPRAEAWQEVSGGRIDPTRPYLQRLPSGRKIALFFYDGPVSQGVAFEGLLENGAEFAQRLTGVFSDARGWPQLVHIATDGETYGHHHRNGDMALAYALRRIEADEPARLTNYAAFLERHPPTHEVEIVEHTSWSCAHGVERWRSDCGCRTGGEPEWSQAWRAPLRAALDWLRDTLAPRFEEAGGELMHDPWAARDAYIDLILDRSPEALAGFLERHARRPLGPDEVVRVLKLLEIQRHALLMYTSCGWFFNELSGIETVQVLQYAGRAVQLAQQLFGDGIEEPFLRRLEGARSNLPEHGDGRRIYEKFVAPAKVDLLKVGAHYAVNSLFEPCATQSRVYCYTVELEDQQTLETGDAKLVVGRSRVTSEITRETSRLTFGVLHFGNHVLNAGVRESGDEAAYQTLKAELAQAIEQADLALAIRSLDRHFQGATYSLRSLFRDQQRRVLDRILEQTLAEAEGTYRGVYERHAPLMRFLLDLGMPLPSAFQITAEFVLNTAITRALADGAPDLEAAERLLDEARTLRVSLDEAGIGFAFARTLERLAARLGEEPGDTTALERLDALAGFALELPFEVQLWRVQNAFFDALRGAWPEARARADAGEPEAADWVTRCRRLGDKLSIALDEG